MDQVAKELMRKVLPVTMYSKVHSPDVDAIWALDLAEMGEWADSNGGYKYILCAVDVFSRYAWCVPLKSKTAKDVWDAFSSLLAHAKPEKIWVDQGGEFYNAVWTRELKRLGIVRYSTYGTHKASIVERFIRTLKSALWFQFLRKQTRAWRDILQEVVNKYNTTQHHGISMTPTEARTEKGRAALTLQLGEDVGVHDKPKFAVDDWVRISRWKGFFEKGFHPNWSYEIYKVREVKAGHPVRYYLQDYDGERIDGAFYGNELQTVKDPEYFPVEKVIKARTVKGQKQQLVQFLGYKDPRWIAAGQTEAI
jgi:hypothetical protein